ncbi:hypothetical protein AKJ16_DCAP11206 [Drosera capensis]
MMEHRKSVLKGCGRGCSTNSYGGWIEGFVANLCRCSSMATELHAVIIGLERSWMFGLRQSQSFFDRACCSVSAPLHFISPVTLSGVRGQLIDQENEIDHGCYLGKFRVFGFVACVG